MTGQPSIDRLIVNSPYEEPQRYWRYNRESRTFTLVEGERRPAGYVIASEGSKVFDDPGVFVAIPLGQPTPSPREDLARSCVSGREWHDQAPAGALDQPGRVR